jgi:hypothetical protein
MSVVWLVPSFRTTRAKFPGIASSNSQISHRHIFQTLMISEFMDLKIRFFKRRGSILTKKQRGWLNKVQVRILLCYMYCIMEQFWKEIFTIFIHDFWACHVCMCSGLKFEFAATIFELKRWYKYVSFIQRLTNISCVYEYMSMTECQINNVSGILIH